MNVQKLFALILLEDIFLRKTLNYYEYSNFSLLLYIFCLLVLAVFRYSVHDYLNDFLDKVLSLLFGNVLLW